MNKLATGYTTCELALSRDIDTPPSNFSGGSFRICGVTVIPFVTRSVVIIPTLSYAKIIICFTSDYTPQNFFDHDEVYDFQTLPWNFNSGLKSHIRVLSIGI